MKKILAALFILIFSFCLAGCRDKQIKAGDISYIEIQKGSFKTVYNVDEKINFDNVYIVIVLKNDKGHIVQKVTPDMLEGFDTSTTTGPTQRRSMRVKYLGMYTSYWDYVVVSEYNIITKARLKLNEKIEGDNFFVTLNLDFQDLSPVYAFMMTVRFDSSQLDYNDDVLLYNSGWELEKRNINPGSFTFIYYCGKEGRAVVQSGDLLRFCFNKKVAGSVNVEIEEITLSDGNNDINLPDVKLI
ncbi:MAG: cohesin domain-containing protein [Christensenellales bacterium]|jgi:hypothetical protein|nr:hypothetical protein [Clostridiales bacterium]